ncbi:MAG: aminotransferase class I/II-fold pyridoxal phosphate-dependent enzyme, partial [Deltaproteobacteria bacterium]|nr:aminotransferase class I/II-fold pyridoxal phosphate-dependent enzyme [Deltaproteobacteria bacterium]
MNLSVPDYILSIKQYVAGKPLEELEREYGIKNSIKLASNENPLGPSPLAVRAIQKEMVKLNRYPDANGYYLRNKLSAKLNVPSENIVLGNGSDDIISMLTRALLSPGDEAIIPRPSFLMYDISVRSVGALPVYVPLCVSSEAISIDLDAIKKRISSKTKMIFLTNPNNPTGTIFTRDEFEKFLENIPPEILIVLDEAYIEFVRDRRCLNSLDFLDSGRALVTLRTFSKAYG